MITTLEELEEELEKKAPKKTRKRKRDPKDDGKTHRTWEFVINNYTEEHVAMLKTWVDVKRLIVSAEVGEKEETPHLQCKVTFLKGKRFSSVKKLIPSAHWEFSILHDDGIYCLKEGSNVLINLDNRRQGQRSDLQDVQTAIVDGKTISDLWHEHFATMVKYNKGIVEGIKFLRAEKVTGNYRLSDFAWEPLDLSKPCVLVGESGIGKTEFALAHFTNPKIVSQIDDLKDLSDLHDGVIFDDVALADLQREEQIHILDIGMTRSIKARFMNATLKKGLPRIFTTNSLARCFSIEDPAVKRRVTVVNLELSTRSKQAAEADPSV